MRVPTHSTFSAPSTVTRTGRPPRWILLASIVALGVSACGGTPASGSQAADSPAAVRPAIASPMAAASPSPAQPSAVPAWIAALGGRILFTKEAGSPTTFTVRTMAPDGTDLRTIGPTSSTSIVHVVWGPGSRFTFDSDRGAPNQVFTMDAVGGDVRAITTGPNGHGWPAVSADGSTIAFDNWIDQTDFGILVTRADGSQATPRTLTTSADPAKGGDSQPAFSPDGKRVAFQRWSTTDRTDPKAVTAAIFVVGIDGKGLKQLTPYDMDAGLPRWSPDGSRILFTDHADTHDASLSANLWTVRPDGSELTQLTHEAGGDFAIEGSWSPDGSAIVFHSWFGIDTFTAIRVMKADGSGATPVLTSPFSQGGAGEMPEWSPTR
jgi:TolB protein